MIQFIEDPKPMSHNAKFICYCLTMEFGTTVGTMNLIDRVFKQAYYIGRSDAEVATVYGMNMQQVRLVRDYYLANKGKLPEVE